MILDSIKIENQKSHPGAGEYLFHTPSEQIVLCGKFNIEDESIQVLGEGRVFVDSINNFKKIRLNRKDRLQVSARRSRCKGCRGV